MAIFIFFGFLMITELFTMFDDWCQDRKEKSPRGYRYGNIPPDVNVIEMWVELSIGVLLGAPQYLLIILMLIQIVIGLNGMCRDIRSQYPHWFNWI